MAAVTEAPARSRSPVRKVELPQSGTSGMGSKTELLNVLGDVKARLQDKIGITDLPLPQFILIGKQSVGKSRLIEALAGQTFNFISGTLGSRRPTVLEFRHFKNLGDTSRWYVRDRQTKKWQEHPIERVMEIVGDAHEELGETVSSEPIYVRIESPLCVDMQIVDLPGFRDFASDQSKQALSDKIIDLVNSFMKDPKNVMLCVEQASDAANMSTLARCRQIDPNFERTILIRNKLDKYYDDLTPENVSKWVDGYGDLPETLTRFALTLPWWQEGTNPSKPFNEMKEDMNGEDLRQMQLKGLSGKYASGIGFKNFVSFMEKRIEGMFVDSIGPVLTKLTKLRNANKIKEKELETEYSETEAHRILSTTRDCGISFATSLSHVMEGVLDLDPVMTLEEELRAFHKYHMKVCSSHFTMLPSEEFKSLEEYIEYLRNGIAVPTADVELNGGAQFRRLLTETEIFLRFSEISVETSKRDVIQARGHTANRDTWRDVIAKLLRQEAHMPLQSRVTYVGERIKWFFECQKESVLNFMEGLKDTPRASIFSPLYPKHAKLIRQNEMIKSLVFKTYDQACSRQLGLFLTLFENMLTSMFSNPWVFIQGTTEPEQEKGTAANSEQKVADEADSTKKDDQVAEAAKGAANDQAKNGSTRKPDKFTEVKERLPKELERRSETEMMLSKWLTDIPANASNIDEAVDKVQALVQRIYGFIRSEVCDQVELFSESFFKLPMMRRLEEDMALMEISADDSANHEARRERLLADVHRTKDSVTEINLCLQRLQNFKLRCDSHRDGGA